MRTIMGFSGSNQMEGIKEIKAEVLEEKPVMSLVRVNFNGVELTYLNEDFNLNVGDMVFVNGSKYGKPGFVTDVTTKFKADKSKLKKVIAHIDTTMKGAYERCLGFVVSSSEDAVMPEQFKSWIIPPEDPDNPSKKEIIVGEGYEANVETFERDLCVSAKILDRAIDYINDGNILYLSVINGVVTAFIEGTEIYEVNFKYENGKIFDLYCDCPYGGFCKHATATLLAFREILKEKSSENSNFIAMESDYFWNHLRMYSNQILLN